MKLNRLKVLATVSAVALSVAYTSGQAWAQPTYDLDSGTAIVVDVTAGVDNTVDLAVVDMDFGNIGVTSDAVDQATMVLSTAGAITEDTAGAAHLVSDDNTGTAGSLAITNAFPTQEIYVDYSNPTALACALCAAPNPTLAIVEISDDLTTPGNLSGPVTGNEATSAGGALTILLGASIQTEATADNYLTGAYAGSFEVRMAY